MIIAATSMTLGMTAQTLQQDNIKEIVKAMTLEEKANLLVGSNRQYEIPAWAAPGMPKREEPDWNKINAESASKSKAQKGVVTNFTSGRVQGAAADNIPVERLGIPSIIFADGTSGLRIDPIREEGESSNTMQNGDGFNKKKGQKTYYCTAFPTGNNLAMTWNPSLVEQTTRAMGNEVREYGVDILLAPAMNIVRNPLGGRSFEYMGEDPLLAGKIAAAYIRGLQSQGVGASLKHFAANNQETWRNGVNVVVSDRALREIYLKGFEIAIKEGKPWTVMSAYPKINGVLCSENHWLLTDILRKEWGYDGVVVTDWWGEENGYRQVLAGNDLMMPGSKHQYQEIVDAVKQGRLDMRQLDWCVENVLRLILKTPTYNNYKYSDAPDLKAHALVSRKAAEESMVLLENNGALPLKHGTSVALFGVGSYDLLVGGSGSGNVNRAYKVSLYDGLNNSKVKLNSEVSNRYLTYVKENKDSSLESFWTIKVLPEIEITTAEAVRAAKKSGVAIFTICRMAGEGGDRSLTKGDYYLSDVERQNLTNVCNAFHKQGKKVIVVMDMGGVIDMADWKDQPDAILFAGLAGQEMGNALADNLTGKVNPSGKLTTTFARKYEDYPSANNFPSSCGIDGEVRYEEDIYVGYRWFDKTSPAPSKEGEQKPLYPFGYGKSYTTFQYSDANVQVIGDSIIATVKVTNTGKVAGKEVVELYASAPKASLSFGEGRGEVPVKELRAFAKTSLLKPHQSEMLKMTFAKSDLASYSNYEQCWILDKGRYTFHFAASANDVRKSVEHEID